MGRSLFGKLHRRFGRRVSGQERQRRAAEHYERLRQAMPVGLVGAPRRIATKNARVAVLGAGFAGVSAAWFASRAGFAVTLIEPLVVIAILASVASLLLPALSRPRPVLFSSPPGDYTAAATRSPTCAVV